MDASEEHSTAHLVVAIAALARLAPMKPISCHASPTVFPERGIGLSPLVWFRYSVWPLLERRELAPSSLGTCRLFPLGRQHGSPAYRDIVGQAGLHWVVQV